MFHRLLLCLFSVALVFSLASHAAAAENYDRYGENWDSSYGSEEGGGGSSYLGVDIADVSAEQLAELKLKEEHGAEVTMVDQDAPAGKAGVHEHDVIVSLNGTAIESTAQLRRMIKETPPGRIVTLGISRDGQPLSIKVQLADRRKSMSWEPKINIQMPKVLPVPNMPDFDMPVSVVVVHQSGRSGLMVENITQQLGEFFGVKGGKGVLVRSVEKGSRGEKAGFRAGDVVVKVNNQPVNDTSDFTHALRSSSGAGAAVTVMRDKKEQNLSLPLPEKKDSGSLIEEDSFDLENEIEAETEQALNRAGDQFARMYPAITERFEEQAWRSRDMQKRAEDRQKRFQGKQKEMQEQQQQMREKLRHEFSGKWTEI